MTVLDQTGFKALLDKFELEIRRDASDKPNDWSAALKAIETAYANAIAPAQPSSPSPSMR